MILIDNQKAWAQKTFRFWIYLAFGIYYTDIMSYPGYKTSLNRKRNCISYVLYT